MSRTIRINGDDVRRFVEEKSDDLPIMPKKLFAILLILLLIFIGVDAVLVGIDKYLGHIIFTYQKDLRGAPYIVIALGFFGSLYLIIMLTPMVLQTLSFRSSIISKSDDFIIVQDNKIRLSNLSEIEITFSRKIICFVTVNDGDRDSFDVVPLCPNVAGIFARIAGIG